MAQVIEGFNDLATTHPILASEWHPHKNGNRLLINVTHGSKIKAWWLCKKGHEWEAVVNNRSRGRGCPICADRQVLIGYNDLSTTHPLLASEWHPTKNGDRLPTSIVKGSVSKVWWQCKLGHEWEAVVNSRNKGNGCPVCAGVQVLVGYNDLETVNPDVALEWHPTKNGNKLPTHFTQASHQNAWWLGKCGHQWKAVVYSRSRGHGCSICAYQDFKKNSNEKEITS